MGQIGNVLLSLNLLLDVGGVISDLELNRVYLNYQLERSGSRYTY